MVVHHGRPGGPAGVGGRRRFVGQPDHHQADHVDDGRGRGRADSAASLPPTTTMPPTTRPPTTARPTTTHPPPHPPTHPPTTAAPATHPPATKPTTTKPPARNCDPAYPDACLHDGIGDYDCAGGSGNGPNYVEGPIRVLPPDPFGLDSDHDGIGCER